MVAVAATAVLGGIGLAGLNSPRPLRTPALPVTDQAKNASDQHQLPVGETEPPTPDPSATGETGTPAASSSAPSSAPNIAASVTSIPTGGPSYVFAYVGSLDELFVGLNYGIDVISTVSNSSVTNISLPQMFREVSMVYDSGEGEVFVAWLANLTIINVTYDSVVTTISVTSWYTGDSCVNDGTLFVGGLTYVNTTGQIWLDDLCGISIISDTTDELVTTIDSTGVSIEQPACLEYDSGANEVVDDQVGDDRVYFYSTSTFQVLNSVPFPTVFVKGYGEFQRGAGLPTNMDCVGYSPSLGEVFVPNGISPTPNFNLSWEAVIPDHGPNNDTILAEIPVGSQPGGVAVDDYADDAFTANLSATITGIHLSTNQTFNETYALPDYLATDIAYNQTSNELFVMYQNSNDTAGLIAAVSLNPSVVLVPSRPAADANTSIVIQSSVQDVDDGPYSYLYTLSGSPAGCGPSSGPTISCTPTSPGVFGVTVKVTDGLGQSATSPQISVTTYPALLAQLNVSNSTPLLGQTVAFVATGSGGNAPYNYTYTGLPPGCVTQDKPAVGCLPTQADFFNATVTIQDANNVTATALVEVHVIFDFNVVVPSSVSEGSPFTLSVNTNETFSGGTALAPASGIGALVYNYTGLPPGCSNRDASSITCTPTQAGTYHVTVSVHDQADDHNSHTVVVNVVAGFLGLAGDTGYLIVGAVAAVVAALVAVLAIRRKGRPRTPSASDKAPPQLQQTGVKTEDKPVAGPSQDAPTQPETGAATAQGSVTVSQSAGKI